MSISDIDNRLFGRLFSLVHDHEIPMKRRNGSIVPLHHSADVGGVHLSANDRGIWIDKFDITNRFQLFSSKRNEMRWRVTFCDIEQRNSCRSDICPVSTGRVIFIRGLAYNGSFYWHEYSFKDIIFHEYEDHSFNEDWIKLRLFEHEWKDAQRLPL